MFPAWKDAEIEHSWRGFVCITADRMTHLGELPDDPGVFYSLAYHGNGVAMATWSGRAVAGLISGRANETIPPTMRQPLRRFPIPALRKWRLVRHYGMRMVKIVATRPLTDDELAAHNWATEIPLYDTRPMFSYLELRVLPDRRLALGGVGGLSGTPHSADRWKAFLKRRIDTMFPAWKDAEIEHSWRGFVCITADRMTHLGELPDDPGVFYSLAYHGNGVAMATWSGRAVAGLISGRANETIPPTMRQPLRRFPIPALRKWRLVRHYGMPVWPLIFARMVKDLFH